MISSIFTNMEREFHKYKAVIRGKPEILIWGHGLVLKIFWSVLKGGKSLDDRIRKCFVTLLIFQ